MGRYRPRREFKFWLSIDKPEESRLIEFIQYCKATRQFARVVRDGLRLIWSLREGNNAVLFELFPHLERQFNPDANQLIEQFQRMLLQHAAAPRALPPPDSTAGQGASKTFSDKIILAAPIFDDDTDDGLSIVAKQGGASSNFMASMFKIAAD